MIQTSERPPDSSALPIMTVWYEKNDGEWSRDTEEARVEAAARSRSLHVLLVDDEPLVLRLVSEYVALLGHTAHTAADGRQGLSKFRRGHFDVVVTDWDMPMMNGHRLTAAVKEVAPGTPVIMMTGRIDVRRVGGWKPLAVDAILGKPMTLAEFGRALADVTREVDRVSEWEDEYDDACRRASTRTTLAEAEDGYSR